VADSGRAALSHAVMIAKLQSQFVAFLEGVGAAEPSIGGGGSSSGLSSSEPLRGVAKKPGSAP